MLPAPRRAMPVPACMHRFAHPFQINGGRPGPRATCVTRSGAPRRVEQPGTPPRGHRSGHAPPQASPTACRTGSVVTDVAQDRCGAVMGAEGQRAFSASRSSTATGRRLAEDSRRRRVRYHSPRRRRAQDALQGRVPWTLPLILPCVTRTASWASKGAVPDHAHDHDDSHRLQEHACAHQFLRGVGGSRLASC